MPRPCLPVRFISTLLSLHSISHQALGKKAVLQATPNWQHISHQPWDILLF